MKRQFFCKQQLHRAYIPPQYLREHQSFRPGHFGRVHYFPAPSAMPTSVPPATAPEPSQPARMPVVLEITAGLIFFVSVLLILILLLTR